MYNVEGQSILSYSVLQVSVSVKKEGFWKKAELMVPCKSKAEPHQYCH